MSLPGFKDQRVAIGEAEYLVTAGGSGPPVVLLHGFPETHACWEAVAPRLADAHRVVALDLRGYGASRAPAGGPRGEGYSKRRMAAELGEVMTPLDHQRFAVVGHDRGARVAYRLALDDPERVSRVALLNIVPTLEQFERMAAGPSLGYWPWFLLAQDAPFPERLLGADPGALLDHVFATWSARPEAIGRGNRKAYREAMTPETIASMCADYRASFYADHEHDADDRAAGRRIAAPLLVITGESETQLADAGEVWRGWAEDVTAAQVRGGHFVPEEAPGELAELLMPFLSADAVPR